MCQHMVSQHMVSQHHILDMALNIIANVNITNNLPTNLSKICTIPLLILTVTLPAKYGNMSITLTYLQFGTNPLTDLQFNLPTNLSAVFLHNHHCMWDNLASNKAGLPITNPLHLIPATSHSLP